MAFEKDNIEHYKQMYKDEECVIITCGPSLNEYTKQTILDFCKNKKIICIKEAIIEFKDYADFFIANHSRHRNFTFNENTIKIYQQSTHFKRDKTVITNYDITLMEDDSYSNKLQLLKTHDFDKYNLVNNKLRPWGPGILYETVFYLCLFMGFKKVYTIGWDLMDTTNEKPTKLTHYFEDNKDSNYINSARWNNQRSINKYYNEMKMVNENIGFMYDYFKNNQMNIIVVGEQSFVNSYIPRILLK